MKLLLSTPAKSLNKAYLKQSLKRDQIDLFRANLARMFERIRTDEHEEHLKNIVSDFLKDTWYKQTHEINTSGRTDLVIHNGTSSNDNVGVLLEVKRPGNSAEMISHEKPNSKALHELLHYYMQERYLKGNLEVRRLIVCNIYEWYIFDAADFERLFFQNKKFVESYQKWSNGLFSGDKTDWLYKEILKPFVEGELENLTCTYFNLKEYERIVRNPARAEDNKLITLYKVLSPPHLLKQTFANDSNSLNKEFYSELLHIIGLEEVKEKGKKLIQRKPEGKRDDGSLLENTCNILKTRGRLSALANPQQYGADADEQYFSVALELCITWLNRLLFLKLLEGQLITYHKGDRSHAFLGSSKIDDFDELNELFFEVLAVRVDERSESVRAKFGTIPYLNSSLFEESDLERATIRINELKNRLDLPLSSSTVLKASNGKRLTGSKNTLNYLFEFLDAYDFGAEGSAEIQEQNKSIINASVLGLIFEKINGYRDGSFFTPGFITMYICRETIRQAVLRKFNDTYGWSCADLTELHNEIYRQRLPLKETNALVNSLKICDPAVGSGHFLVSALNELIAIKNTLGILADRDGKLLRCDLTIENDELIVTIDDQIFEYRYKDSESQRIQETLFHEKEIIIENCLFGVDINPKSVMICRLRLWIELLKNAYYRRNSDQLETLPNIDINIKCGNSLVSRFAITGNPNILPGDRKKLKELTERYRRMVFDYKLSPANKTLLRKEIEKLKHLLENFGLPNDKDLIALWKAKDELAQLSLFGFDLKEQNRRQKLHENVEKLEQRFEEKQRLLYSNAFEWRFEFPEVLDDAGEFIGFDAVIGNPPYGLSFVEEEISLLKDNYKSFEYQANSYVLFMERADCLLKVGGVLDFIVPATFTYQKYFNNIRLLFGGRKITRIKKCIFKVFDDADIGDAVCFQVMKSLPKQDDTVDIVISRDSSPLGTTQICRNYSKLCLPNGAYNLSEINIDFSKLATDSEILGNISEIVVGIKPYQVGKGKPKQTRDTVENKIFTSSIKVDDSYLPCINGKDFTRYSFVSSPKMYLKYGQWLAEPREIAPFFKSKIILRQTADSIIAVLDETKSINLNNVYNIGVSDPRYDLRYILALLNSKLINIYYQSISQEKGRLFAEVKKVYLEQIPIKIIDNQIQEPIITLANKILAVKQADHKADISTLEAEIDQLVYALYNLTDEEIALVEGKA